MHPYILRKNHAFPGIHGPLVLVIMDGVGLYRGIAQGYPGNAFDAAYTPHLDHWLKEAPVRGSLLAHGTAVGLPGDDDMGNSEVGHNALGAGRVFAQGAKLVNEAIATGRIFEGPWAQDIGTPEAPGHVLAAWEKARTRGVDPAEAPHAVHLLGLLSDGNVHSHIDHLFALIDRLGAVGAPRVLVHPLADGRDVDEVSYHRYLAALEQRLASWRDRGLFYHVASGGGRMRITMDRYQADWSMVRRGWDTHVAGRGRLFPTAREAVDTLRAENPGVIDQDLPPFVVSHPADATRPVGPMADDDVVILFNFRGDRAIEISQAFTEEHFSAFPRDPAVKVRFLGMMQYDGDLKLPPRFLVTPPHIEGTVSHYLAQAKVRSLAISETQKFGHVTYFWNGNNSRPADPELENWVEIPSDIMPFEQKPAMKAQEITDRLITELDSGRYQFIRVNYPNGDMVGHTGSFGAAVEAMNVLDRCLGRLWKAVDAAGGVMVIIADHGNCDQMYEVDAKTGAVKTDKGGKPRNKTSHTLNPVPFIVLGKEALDLTLAPVERPGLANVASTLVFLLGYEPPEGYEPSLVRCKES